MSELQKYDSIIVAGPWQRGPAIRTLYKNLSPSQNIYYLPRGGLAAAEFSRPRDLKKLPYLALVENERIRRTSSIVFSSKVERDSLVSWVSKRAPRRVIPDFVDSLSGQESTDCSGDRRFTFGFLAEISPRKGLLPLVQAFGDFLSSSHAACTLKVGGAPRPGSERYARHARRAAASLGDRTVQFSGAVKHEHRASFFSGVDVLVVASAFESYGLTVLEALSEGVGVIITPDVGVGEYLGEIDGLYRASGCDRSGLRIALQAAYHDHEGSSSRARRAARAAAAKSAIEAVNLRAGAEWASMLGM
ncbi:glycosyltransferase family 4 protein [Phenylobacterium sp. VNQ135]|uniref:glycosyltransferase family 4 protein n=1 Tax=Phenylobacterium sp. VNQ135 TaxID=3400922 RepID=UPI003C1028DE